MTGAQSPRTRSRLAVLVALGALVLAIAGARPAAAATSSNMAGKVTDANGTPVAGVQVALFGLACIDDPNGCPQTTTAPDGTYSFTGITTASWTVNFTPPAGTGFASQCWNNTFATQTQSCDAVTLTDGQTTAGINAVLQRQAFVTGTVTGPDGNPLSGIGVAVTGATGIGHATTAADGTYSITIDPLVGAGTFTVEFNTDASINLAQQWWNNQPTAAAADPITIAPGQTVTGINAQLQANVGSISGTVSGATGTSAARVSLFTPGGTTPVASQLEDRSGNYTFTQVAPGSYQVEFAADGFQFQWWDGAADQGHAQLVTVTAGQATIGINGSLQQPAPPMVVTGAVTGPDGNPVAGIPVEADYCCTGVTRVVAGSATTAADGTYTMDVNAEASPDQTFIVEFNSYPSVVSLTSPWWNGQPSANTATPIPFTMGGSVSSINGQLAPNFGAISGTITTPGGQPIAGARVYADGPGPTQNQSTTYGPAVTAEDGTYTLSNVPAGAALSYHVRFDYGTQEVQYNGGLSVQVALNQTTTGIDGQFPAVLQGGTLNGVVTSGNSQTPVAGATVVLANYFGFTVGQTTTGPDGSWVIGPVPGGVYRVQFQPPFGSGLLSEWWNNQPDIGHSNGINVANQQTVTGINANLSAGASISGTVSDANGPLANAPVGLFHTDANGNATDEFAHTTSAADGTYQFANVTNGNYRILFDAPPGSTDSGTWQSVSVADAPVTNVNATLAPGTRGTISGKVTDTSGNPIAGVTATAVAADGTATVSATTAADGSYSIGGLDVGIDTVWFVPPAGSSFRASFWNNAISKVVPIPIDQGSNVTGINAKLSQNGTVTGTVTGPSGPIAGATVTVTNYYGFTEATATTAANGTYTVSGLGPGASRVRFTATGFVTQWWNNQPDEPHSNTINVPNNGTATANATLVASS